MSGVGKVTDEARRVRGVAEAAIAEARSVHGEVESRVASLAGAGRCEHRAHCRCTLATRSVSGGALRCVGVARCW